MADRHPKLKRLLHWADEHFDYLLVISYGVACYELGRWAQRRDNGG